MHEKTLIDTDANVQQGNCNLYQNKTPVARIANITT